jgi:predicted alpha/beta hydrolase
MTQTSIQITCADGVVLSGALFEPSGAPRAVVQLNGATATPYRFYVPMAQYLVEQGYAVLLYDYRGVCTSTPTGGLRGCTYEYLDWGRYDMPAALAWLSERFPGLSKLALGHSVGGQLMGFVPEHDSFAGMVAVATSAGYWGFMPWGYRLQTHFFFEIFRPLSKWIWGYTAAKRFGLMEDLPYKMTDTWRDWCSVPTYFFHPKYAVTSADQGFFKEFSMPMQVYWMPDDPISNERSVFHFWKNIQSSGGISIEKIVPKDYGLTSIGHFGFFRKQGRAQLWPKVLAAFEVFLEAEVTH